MKWLNRHHSCRPIVVSCCTTLPERISSARLDISVWYDYMRKHWEINMRQSIKVGLIQRTSGARTASVWLRWDDSVTDRPTCAWRVQIDVYNMTRVCICMYEGWHADYTLYTLWYLFSVCNKTRCATTLNDRILITKNESADKQALLRNW